MVSKQAIIESFRKGFRDKTKFFIPFIFLLTVAVVIFGLFNIDLFNKLPITAILSTIAGALAAILAIVFAISQIIISNLSERYSPYILERYKNDPKTMRTLFGFVTVITLSILLLFINAFLPPTISFMLLSALLFGFVYSFSSFIKYFYFMFEIINPLEFASILEKETIEHIKNQNEKEIQNYISSMGDISVKSLQRNEERVCNEYIQTLYNVFDEFFNLKEANPEKYKPVVNLSYYDRDNAKNNILGYVLDQYSRIYKEAVFRKAEGITMETYLKMSFILDKCFRGKDTNLVEQMLKAEYLLSEFTIENKDKSRFYLIHHLTEKQGRIEDKHLDKFISSHLFEVTRLIIDHDDFELFKSEIDYFSMGSIQSPDKIQEEIKDELYLEDMHDSIYQNEEIFKEIEGKRNYLQFLIKYTLSKDFENKKEFEEKLEEFEELVIGHLEKMKEGTYYKSKILREFDEITTEEFENVKRQIEDSIKKVKEKIEGNEHELRSIKHWLKEHYITSKVHKTFFVIGAYILFKGKEGRIDAERYLRELWEHTHPEDAHAIIGNETPVTFDPSWLTYLLFYGGKNSAIWLHDMGVRFEGFHGTTVYAYQYYLLCIAKSIEKGGNNLGLPQRNDLEKMLKENRTYELEELYQFTNGFKLETDEHLIKYCDVLIKESDNWNALFKNNAKEALEKTKEWVNTTSKECKTVKEEIETILPLDLEKVAKCREDIFKSYKESSEIPEVVQVKEFGEERDKELEFIQIYKSPLIRKDCLIKPSFVDCSTRWFELGRSVAVGEINYLIKRILEDERIERVGLRARGHEKIFNEIKSVAGSLKEQNYKPSVVFIPLEIFTEFVKKRLAKRSEHLRIDEDTELKVINSSKLTPFEDIIILDKTAGIWTFEPDEEAEGRLVIEIKEYDADKSKVDLLAKTVVNFRIVDPNAIKILKIKQGSSISARMK